MEKLLSVEDQIMKIVYRLVDENKYIDLTHILNISRKELHYDGFTLMSALENLQKSKKIIFGQKLIRDILLRNSTRQHIFTYLKEFPGSRLSEISEHTHIPLQVICFNLAIMVKFNCVNEIKLNKIKIYGIFRDSSNWILISYIWRNEKLRLVISLICKRPYEMTEISKETGIPSNMIHYICNLLLKNKIINVMLENDKKVYTIQPDYLEHISSLI